MVKQVVIVFSIMLMLMLAHIFTPTTGNRLQANYGNILANTYGLGGHTVRNRNRYGDGTTHHFRRHGYVFVME